MQVTKAHEVLKAYRESGFNASKALIKVGYTKDTASKASKPIINRAIKAIANDNLKSLVQSDNAMKDLFALVNVSSADVISEYVKIFKQDKDLATKLKAMFPLLATLGIKWNEDAVKTTPPTLTITMETPNTVDTAATAYTTVTTETEGPQTIPPVDN